MFKQKTALITGSSGLVGSEAVMWFDRLGWKVIGIDNNMRMEFFGPEGDTRWNLAWLKENTRNFFHLDLDIRNREGVFRVFSEHKPGLIIHCAAQPSHDWAASSPLVDWDINATGTVNLLEATRLERPESPFAYVSTNKVYGDTPNNIPMVELATRYDYARPEDFDGIDEHCGTDRCLHSLFGASKLAGDVMAQEYGRYFNMPVGIFRGGCLTGSHHSGVQLHGFLSYLVISAVTGKHYTILGYKGKQVRDNIHSYDVVHALYQYYLNPRPGEVYNLGGGRENSVSILEAIASIENLLGRKISYSYVDKPRNGDHICYISNLKKLKNHFPQWSITRPLQNILAEMVEFELQRAKT
jgi:CDP-paratose 2-epimerase